MIAAYVDELVGLPPEAVTKGCQEWGRNKTGWPALAELLTAVKGYVPKPRSLSDPSKPEDFLTRCKRVGGHDAIWQSARHYLLEPAFQAHMDGYLSDEDLAIRLVEADNWLTALRMPRPKKSRDLDDIGAGLALNEQAEHIPPIWPNLEAERQTMAQKAMAESAFKPTEEELRASMQRLLSTKKTHTHA